MLESLAYIAPDIIPKHLILVLESRAKGGTELLCKYALLQENSDGTYSIHRLIQLALRTTHFQLQPLPSMLAAEITFEKMYLPIDILLSCLAVFKVLTKNFTAPSSNIDNLRLIPHLESLLNQSERYAEHDESVDLREALRYFEMAAKQGNVPSQLKAGAFLRDTDAAKAHQFFEMAAKAGDIDAQLIVASNYYL